MWQGNIKFFLSRLVLIYVLLLLPWPGFGEAYGVYFRALGRAAFSWVGGQWELTFEPPDKDSPHAQDSRVAIVNRALMAPDGSGPVRYLRFEARRMGWDPMALLIALVVATPIPWRRRIGSLLWGTLCVHGFVLFTLGVGIWNESAEIALVTLTPFGKTIATGCTDMLTNQIGLVAPVLIWLLVTFRREDGMGKWGLLDFGKPDPASGLKRG